MINWNDAKLHEPATDGHELHATGDGSYVLLSAQCPLTQWIETDHVVELRE